MRRALTNAAVAIAVLPAVLSAQRVNGTLHDSTSTLPLNGAVVSVVDSGGVVTARTIADGGGTFSLPLPLRAARLRVIRIGYQPRDVPLPADRQGGNVRLAVSLSRIPPVLSTVRVSGAELCPGSTDRGAAFQLWEQARAGLLATVVARETNPADVAALVYQRNLRPRDDLITHQTVALRTGRTSRPFLAAATPEDFATMGYVKEDSTGARTYNAPDEQVLLDESFAATHCFHLQPADTAHAGQIGLAFTPARQSDTNVDVAGVIWMDAVVPAVRALDFRFTNLEPAAMDAATGGHVDFRSLNNGVSFIDWWNLRLPLLSRPALRSSPDLPPIEPRRRRDRTDYRVTQLVETGGEVLVARWKDNTTWQAGTTGVTGTITQHGSHAPIPFALVALAGTTDTVMADAQGRFELEPVPAGRYTLTARDTTLSTYVPERMADQVITIRRDSLTMVTLEPQSSADLIQTLCKDQHPRGAPSAILGHLVAPDTRGIEVRATWHALAGSSGVGVAVETASQASTVDDGGHFVICVAGQGQAVQLHVARDGIPVDTTIITNESFVTPFEWRLPPAPRKPLELTELVPSGPGRLSAFAAPPYSLLSRGSGPRFATLSQSTHQRRPQQMSDHSHPHNGRDLHGKYGVPKADVEDLLEDPAGAERVRDNIKTAGAIADTGPHAAEPAQHITELITENRDDVGRVTGRTRK